MSRVRLKSKFPQNRERRLDAVSAYLGDVESLAREFSAGSVNQRIRTFAQSTPDDLILALHTLASIPEAVTVVHGPLGCGAAALHQRLRGGGRYAVTGLDERDTIMGGDVGLRRAVLDLHRRYSPQVVFLVATPTVAINNDDMEAVADELREELAIAVIPVYTSGFASKIAANGYDTVVHALFRQIDTDEVEVKGEFVNLLALGEEEADRLEGERLLAALGLVVNTLPEGAPLANFAQARSAQLSIPLDPAAAHYLGDLFATHFQVVVLAPPRPIGLGATGDWLAAIGAAVGREAAAATLQAQEAATVALLLAAAPLQGKDVYISLPAATAFGVRRLVEELGGRVIGLSVEHLDQSHNSTLAALAAENPEAQLHVAHGQAFEEVNILQRSKPDLYIGSGGPLLHVARLGIPVISLAGHGILGYRGIATFARLAERALTNRSFIAALAGGESPYREAWSRRSAHWHIKQEVK